MINPEGKDFQGYDLNNHFDYKIDVYSEDNPFSVRNCIPKTFKTIIESMDRVPENMKDRDPFELRDELKPNMTLNQLRINFWTEYDQSLGNGTKMKMNKIIAGVCTMRTFTFICKKPENIAWILTPVSNYQTGVQDILETCLFKMRQGLEKLDMTDVKHINAVSKIYESFDKRVHGDYVKREEKRVEHVRTDNDDIKKLGGNEDIVVEYNNEKEKHNKDVC